MPTFYAVRTGLLLAISFAVAIPTTAAFAIPRPEPVGGFKLESAYLPSSTMIMAAGTPAAAPATHTTKETPGGDTSVRRSPKAGWGDFPVVEEKGEYPLWATILLWVPNRVLDLIDTVRVDAGVGPAVGGVVRITKWGQAGVRHMMPGSLRIGDFGRDWPVMVETEDEYGFGPYFVNSKERKICKYEIGAGVDLFIVGAQLGVCPEEIIDFAAGLFFLDPQEDDLK